MSTWNRITIEKPGTLTLDTLPDALRSHGEIWDGYDAEDTREGVPSRTLPSGTVTAGREADPDGVIYISGGSKWRPDEAIAALLELSKTTGRITHHQEWDDDEVGQSEEVYEGGEEIESARRVSDLVPANLRELIADARTALPFDSPSPAVVDALSGTLTALVNALDPEGARG